MNNTDRIELAEWMGCALFAVWPDGEPLFHKNGEQQPYRFDPYTNANDTEAVIRKLNESYIAVHIAIYDDGNDDDCAAVYRVEPVSGEVVSEWHGKDWRLGVCTLALQVKREG